MTEALCLAGIALGGFICGAVIGWAVGLWHCERSHHCILQQRRDVKRWQKEITGEITPGMQARLAKRKAAADRALKATGEHAAAPAPKADR